MDDDVVDEEYLGVFKILIGFFLIPSSSFFFGKGDDCKPIQDCIFCSNSLVVVVDDDEANESSALVFVLPLDFLTFGRTCEADIVVQDSLEGGSSIQY